MKWGRGRSWYPNVTLDSHLYYWRKSRKFSLCPPVSSGWRLGPQHLKGKRRVIVKAKHKIMPFCSYLVHSSSNLLWSLVAPFRAKDRDSVLGSGVRVNMYVWVMNVILYPRLIYVYRWRILFLYTCSSYVYIAELFSYTHVLFFVQVDISRPCIHVWFLPCL